MLAMCLDNFISVDLYLKAATGCVINQWVLKMNIFAVSSLVALILLLTSSQLAMGKKSTSQNYVETRSRQRRAAAVSAKLRDVAIAVLKRRMAVVSRKRASR